MVNIRRKCELNTDTLIFKYFFYSKVLKPPADWIRFTRLPPYEDCGVLKVAHETSGYSPSVCIEQVTLTIMSVLS